MVGTIKNKIKREAYNILGFKVNNSQVGMKNEKTRVSWLEETLKKIPKGYKILDAGAGELQFKKFCNHLNYVSQDFAQYNGTGDERGLQMKQWDNSKIDIVSDITNIPVANESFDAVMCIEVLEHVPDPVSALKELDRVLKSEGHLIITAPFCSLTHFSPYHFATGFNKYFYEKHLNDLGYTIIDIIENGNYFEYLAQELRRVEEITHKYARMKLLDTEKKSIQALLNLMDKASIKSEESEELLCFGYHILAKKLRNPQQ